MDNSKVFDRNQAAIALSKITGNRVFEVRVKSGSKTQIGTFRNPGTAVEMLDKMNLTGATAEITVNGLNDGCYSRINKDSFKQMRNFLQSDDVESIEWLPLKAVPIHPAGVSSTVEELNASFRAVKKASIVLNNYGFTVPIFICTGNEWMLLYKVECNADQESDDTAKRFIRAVGMLCNTETVKFQVPGNIATATIPLPGLLAQVGANDPDRSHRPCYARFYPEVISCTEFNYAAKFASDVLGSESAAADFSEGMPGSFDVERFLSDHGVKYTVADEDGYKKYILNGNPFDESDTEPLYVIRRPDGLLTFRSLNEKYKDLTWRDFKKRIAPTERDARMMANEEAVYHSFARNYVMPEVKEESDEPMFLSPMEIQQREHPKQTYVRTGITTLDRHTRGLGRGQISIWSGLRSGGKSTLLQQICLNAVQDGNRVIYYSGEVTDDRYMRWTYRQAAGKAYCIPSEYYEHDYTIGEDAMTRISEWMEGKFWLYNNHYGHDAKAILASLDHFCRDHKVDLIVLDNLMSLNLMSYDSMKYMGELAAQTHFVQDLKRLAEKHMCHVAFVAHPRKEVGLLRLDSISGTGNLANAVDLAVIAHRNNDDFKRLAVSTLNKVEGDPMFSGTNAIEICKDKDNGTQDLWIPLWYEDSTKRLRNDIAENIIYGWDKKGVKIPTTKADREPTFEQQSFDFTADKSFKGVEKKKVDRSQFWTNGQFDKAKYAQYKEQERMENGFQDIPQDLLDDLPFN